MNKEHYITESKQFRKEMDDTLQRMKTFRQRLIEWSASPQVLDYPAEAIAQHTLSIRDLENAMMRQGMLLKNIGTPSPYPNSKLTVEELAQRLYEAYCEHTGWKSAHSGAPLPHWDLVTDPIKDAWRAAAASHPALTVVEPTADGLKM